MLPVLLEGGRLIILRLADLGVSVAPLLLSPRRSLPPLLRKPRLTLPLVCRVRLLLPPQLTLVCLLVGRDAELAGVAFRRLFVGDGIELRLVSSKQLAVSSKQQ